MVMKRGQSDFPVSESDMEDAVQSSPDPETPLVEGDTEAADAAEAKMVERLQMFQAKLATLRDEFVQGRATQGLDKRWSEDVMQYKGQDYPGRHTSDMMTSVEQGFPVSVNVQKTNRSTIFVQMTRVKTNAAAARLDDALTPTDEPAFSVSPTPLPELPSFVQVPSTAQPSGAPAGGQANTPPAPGQTPPMGAPPIGGPQPAAAAAAAQPSGAPGGQPASPAAAAPAPVTPVDAATQALMDKHEEAKKRSTLMQQEIEQQFDECDYNAENRKVVFDAALYGTGVMKGPIVLNRTRKAWTKKTDVKGASYWMLDVVKELTPASFRVDPKLFYPDPACGENLQNGRGSFELDKKTKKQVRELRKQPEYIHSQLVKVLEEGPSTGKALRNLGEEEDRDIVAADMFEHWMYWGEIDRDDLIAAGVQIEDDELVVTSACIEMINSTVVRAYLNPLENGDLPYDMVPYERCPGSAWGYGVPYLMRAGQRVINSAWRMILDNAGVCAGPQIVMNPHAVTPADKRWELSARKIWWTNADVVDTSKVFSTFQFESHQAELQSILEQAEKLAEAETAGPMTGLPDKSAVPETVGGMQIQKQQENVGLRRQVKQWDDCITKPQVRRYYDYNMEYSPKDEIKGDFNVVALGSSALLMREIEGQSLDTLMTMATNPVFSIFVNAKKLFMKYTKAKKVDPSDVMNSDNEIAAAQKAAAANQQPDPRLAAAQLQLQGVQAKIAADKAIAQEAQQTKMQIASQATQVALETLKLERDIETLRVSLKQGISVEQVRAQLAAVAIRERSQTERQLMQHQADAAMQSNQHTADAAESMAQRTADLNQQTADSVTAQAADNAAQGHEAAMQAADHAHQASQTEVSQDHQADLQGDAQDHQADMQSDQQDHEASMPQPTTASE